MRRKSITSEMMKSYIADSLLILMEHNDFQDITIGEIVEKAGVNRSTYYRHFDKKEDVILYFLDHLSKTFVEWARPQNLVLEDYLTKLYAHYLQHKKQMLTIYKNGLSALLLDILRKCLGGEGMENKPVSEQYDIAYHIGGTFNHFLLWFSRDMVDLPETMAKYTLAVLAPSAVEKCQMVSEEVSL